MSLLLLYVLTNKCQYWAVKLSKFTTNCPQLYVCVHIERLILQTHVCLCANKLNCKVRGAVFILIDRVKHHCQDGIRFRQNKP